MRILRRVSHAIDRLNDAIGAIATWAVLLACVICVANALAHYAYDIGSNAWLEIQWYLFALVVMFGAAPTLKNNEHVRVDILYTLLGPRGKLWLDLVGALLFLLPVCAVFGYLAWPVFVESYTMNEMSSNAGGLIRWPFKLLLPVGFGLVALQGISEVIKRALALQCEAAIDTGYERPLQ